MGVRCVVAGREDLEETMNEWGREWTDFGAEGRMAVADE